MSPHRTSSELRDIALSMAGTLRHRGPDDGDEWCDAAAGVTFGHRRLSILDLSSQGRQPMTSASGRTVLVYNGEIYNHRELRRELQGIGVRFRGTSDTEVLVEACEHWGPARTAERLIGMFAFAVWDQQARRLTLIRDRMGIKPLYVAEGATSIVFGSEVRAFRAHPDFSGEIDRDVLAAYFRRNCIPSPYSIYRGIRQVAPGTGVVYELGRSPEPFTYWSLEEIVRSSVSNRATDVDPKDLVDHLERLLTDAVATRMLADVPVGAFLSGGIDSSTVVALMQSIASQPIRTFTIGTSRADYDESRHARAIAEHLGTDHTELIVEPQHVIDLVPELLGGTDEPFADSSYIPTWLVSELARRHVTVSLSGDGGDEVFAGYTRHVVAASRLGRLLSLPVGARRSFARLLTAVPPARWDALARMIPEGRRPPRVGDQLHKAAGALEAADLDEFYARVTTHWHAPDSLVVGGQEAPSWVADWQFLASVPEAVDRMMYLDSVGYLPDDILTKVDRASMAVSLEARVPILDHRVVEFAWTLPTQLKVRDGTSKWVLRQVLERYVPAPLFERPKQGFGIPIDTWLRGPLRPWAEELLDPTRLRNEGYLHPEPIQQLWQEHLSGTRNRQYELWDVLSFQAWRAGRGAAP